MTTITITIPDAITQRVVLALCHRWGYSDTLEDGTPNTETKSAFVKRKMIEHLKRSVKEAEVEIAKNEAASLAGTSVDNDIQIN